MHETAMISSRRDLATGPVFDRFPLRDSSPLSPRAAALRVAARAVSRFAVYSRHLTLRQSS